MLVNDPGMHHATCVTHMAWCMSGSLTCGGGEKVHGIPGAWVTRNFTSIHLAWGPWEWLVVTWLSGMFTQQLEIEIANVYWDCGFLMGLVNMSFGHKPVTLKNLVVQCCYHSVSLDILKRLSVLNEWTDSLLLSQLTLNPAGLAYDLFISIVYI